MNTSEKIVESYFRLCRDCFTIADLKVISGNNRQIDLLAYNLKAKEQYHIEVSVTHQENWCPTPNELTTEFDRKFFGVPVKREGKNTDFTLGKNYKKQIDLTYESVGFNPKNIKLIWVCWTLRDGDSVDKLLEEYCNRRGLPKDTINVISFRDDIIPSLMDRVGTSNYGDDVLRTLSFLQQFQKQTTRNLLS